MILTLNNKLYRREAILEALNVYSEFCEGSIVSNDFKVELRPKESLDNLGEEFSNYVLGLMQQ